MTHAVTRTWKRVRRGRKTATLAFALCTAATALGCFFGAPQAFAAGNTCYAQLDGKGTLTFYAEEPASGSYYTIDADANHGVGDGTHTYTYNLPWTNPETGGKVKGVKFAQRIAPSNMDGWFVGCSSITKFDATNLDTSRCTSMEESFAWCTGLKKLDLSGFDTSNVEDMGHMFYECTSLKELDVTGWNTSKVQDFGGMFKSCVRLETLDLAHFKTPSARNFSIMFYDCACLNKLDISGFDTSNVQGIAGMFDRCDRLKTIKLGDRFSFICPVDIPIYDGTTLPTKGKRYTDSDLPEGSWKSSADGKSYKPNALPSNVAATYTNVKMKKMPTRAEELKASAKAASSESAGINRNYGSITYTVGYDRITGKKALLYTQSVPGIGKVVFSATSTKLRAYTTNASAKALPRTIELDDISFTTVAVVSTKAQIAKKALKGRIGSATEVVVRAKGLKKKDAKGSFKGTKVKRAFVQVSAKHNKKAKAANAKWAKKYRTGALAEKACGKKVTVTACA